jgi:hypothetical protein
MEGAQPRVESVLYGNGERSQRVCGDSKCRAGCDGRSGFVALKTDTKHCAPAMRLYMCVHMCVYLFVPVCV